MLIWKDVTAMGQTFGVMTSEDSHEITEKAMAAFQERHKNAQILWVFKVKETYALASTCLTYDLTIIENGRVYDVPVVETSYEAKSLPSSLSKMSPEEAMEVKELFREEYPDPSVIYT